MLKKLVLIGGGGFSSEVAEVAVQNGFEVIGYVDMVQNRLRSEIPRGA